MTHRSDTFARFIDVLADALDDHEATGADLAARLYLSRFHLDRIVTSVGGEPPATLRRRLLLERAAYRLATTQAPILQVATEAGYGSHEAFTRAFIRGFGVGPRDWRTHPVTFTIDAPNDVHFQPPGTIRLPSTTKVTPMDLLTRMIEHHIWLTGEMITVAGRLTDTQLDEHIRYDLEDDPDELTIRRLLSRLVGQMGMWNAALAHRDYDWSVEQHESVTSLRCRLAEEGPIFLTHVREAVDDGRLDDTFVDALCTPAEVFTYGGMVAHVLTFAAHRRTLVVLAFDRLGITDLGWGDPMKWVAEPVS